MRSTGGMNTQSRPSRGSTESAVRTAPPRSPSLLLDALLRRVVGAVTRVTGWARLGAASRRPGLGSKSGRAPRGTVGSAGLM